MHLHRSLEEEERSASHQDEIPPGETVAEEVHHRLRKADDPGHDRKQNEAREQCQAEAHEKRMPALGFRQGGSKDGDKDEVVDTEDNLEQNQGTQPGPGRGVGDPCKIPERHMPATSVRSFSGTEKGPSGPFLSFAVRAGARQPRNYLICRTYFASGTSSMRL